MNKNKRLLIMLVGLIMVCLLTGCFMDKSLEKTSVKGNVYTLELELPFAIKSEVKDMTLDSNTAIFITNAKQCMERPTGEPIHLAEFTVNTFNKESIDQEYGTSDDKRQQFYENFGKLLTASYLKSLSTAAGITNLTSDSKTVTIDGHKATVTTVNGKLKGEAEIMKIIYIEDDSESWLINLAYPQEKDDSIGKQIDEKIIPGIKLVNN